MTLDPTARELIRRSRAALRPNADERARTAEALRARLGADAFEPDVDAGVGRVSWQSAVKLTLCIGLIGPVAFWAYGSMQPQTPTTPSPRAVVAPQPAAAETPVQETPAAPATAAPTADPAPPPAAKTAARDTLSREVALMSRATSALRTGDLAAALRSLDEHARKYPHGVLREERRAARAQALCGAGRFTEGRAELEGLPAHSPTAARAQQLCRTE